MKRILESTSKLEIETNELVVLSNYFTSKIDPQRKIKQVSNNFDYIKDWYNSIVINDLKAIIFHDNLDLEFVSKYETKKIKFIKCTLGKMSVNDERFFVFNEYLNQINNSCYILISDINDVIIKKSPLELFLMYPRKLFIGRDEYYNWRSGYWTLYEIREFHNKFKYKIPSSFLFCPMFNAGLIGGDVTIIREMLDKMESLFVNINSEGNYNMIVLNLTIFNHYYRPNKYKFLNFFNLNLFLKINASINGGKISFLRSFFNESVTANNSGVVNSKKIFSGYPFNSLFKKFESPENTSAYLIHK
jgi:hypothetical protein